MATTRSSWTIDPVHEKIAAAFRAETAVDRRDFEVTWNTAMDTGGVYLGGRPDL